MYTNGARAIYFGDDSKGYVSNGVDITITRNSCSHDNTEILDSKLPTCKSEGYTGDTYCIDCMKKLSVGKTIAKLPHTYDSDEDASCNVCGEIREIQTKACEHKNTESRNVVKETCTVAGYTGDIYCLECHEIVSEGTTVAALGHIGGEATCSKKAICTVCGLEYGNFDSSKHGKCEVRNASEATYSVEGYTGDTYCIDCGSKISSGSIIPMLQSGDWEIDDSGDWIFRKPSGEIIKDDWVVINSMKYYFNEDGKMQTSWTNVNDEWYYMDSSGVMQTGWLNINDTLCYMNDLGVMEYCIVKYNDKWYYTDSSKVKESATFNINGNEYKVEAPAKTNAGWISVNNKWYYLKADGTLLTGWLSSVGTWYYMYPSGDMATSWADIDDDWYYMNNSGEMQTGWVLDGTTWYYMNPSGAMATGWILDGTTWYYMYSSGAMAHDTVIGGYRLSSSGAWIQ